ncbi:hypothetical protein AALO_G00079710 [Alosa alosa]|uniref:Uncharacterized protein n=1 Tax=Alosa alosa TaxID=278164 RepID=A0AAV6H0R3_9TELE|nr:hypothetical protein AALO_G00079710 [Alosa alosa]
MGITTGEDCGTETIFSKMDSVLKGHSIYLGRIALLFLLTMPASIWETGTLSSRGC